MTCRNTRDHPADAKDYPEWCGYPVYFAKPFTTKKVLRRQIGDYIFDHTCLENEKDQENLVPAIGDAGR